MIVLDEAFCRAMFTNLFRIHNTFDDILTTSLCDRKDVDKNKLSLLNAMKINPLPGFYINVMRQFTVELEVSIKPPSCFH